MPECEHRHTISFTKKNSCLHALLFLKIYHNNAFINEHKIYHLVIAESSMNHWLDSNILWLRYILLSKWWANFSLQTIYRMSQHSGHSKLHTQSSRLYSGAVPPTKGLEYSSYTSAPSWIWIYVHHNPYIMWGLYVSHTLKDPVVLAGYIISPRI